MVHFKFIESSIKKKIKLEYNLVQNYLDTKTFWFLYLHYLFQKLRHITRPCNDSIVCYSFPPMK